MTVIIVLKSFLIVGVFTGFGTTFTPQVDTKTDKIVGIQRSFKEGKANFFLGIPFAKPPIGDLRFKKSVPYKSSKSVIKATDFKPICYQPRIEIIGADNPYKQSEDCLYLNIVQKADALKDGKKRAVIVITEALGINFLTEYPYITVSKIYQLPLRHDIISVYISSRRNIFGFAYSKKYPQLEGNYALWDQNLALQWIQENIEYFGGDPKVVTLLGLGPGATEVESHIISPYAKNLFQNAIVLRSALVAVGDDANGRTSLTTEIVIKRVGCGDAKDVLTCLQKVPPKKFIDSLTIRYEPLRPVFESEYIPSPLKDVITKSFFNDVNILFGFDRDSASNLVAISAPQVWANVKFTYDDALEIINKIFNKDYSKFIAQKYIGSKSDNYDDLEIRKAISNLFTDIVYACPFIDFAFRSASRQKKGQTYGLINYYQPSTSVFTICKDDPRLGVCEREFASLVSGDAFIFPDYFNNTDREASAFAMQLISNFAKTGSPSKGKWPSFNSKKGVKLNMALFTPHQLIIDDSRAEFCHKYVYDFQDNVLDKYYPLDPEEKPEQAKIDAKSSFYGFLYNTYHYVATQFYRL